MGGSVQVCLSVLLLIIRDNWLFNVGLLRRLDTSKLRRLNLPLLLEEELARIIVVGRADASPIFVYVRAFDFWNS